MNMTNKFTQQNGADIEGESKGRGEGEGGRDDQILWEQSTENRSEWRKRKLGRGTESPLTVHDSGRLVPPAAFCPLINNILQSICPIIQPHAHLTSQSTQLQCMRFPLSWSSVSWGGFDR